MKPSVSNESRSAATVPGRGRRFVPILVVAVFVLVCVSRAAVFPSSVWEQDEAYFAAAVVEIDIQASCPHPPFFPLWIWLGKLLHLTGLQPAASLQLASAVLGSLVFLPLVALWSRFMTPVLAVAAATLGLAVPGVWLLSGRAFSGTAATALLILALALWTRPDLDARWIARGSIAAGLTVLIRPHFALAVAAVMVVLALHHPRRRWVAIVAPAALLIAGGGLVFVVAAGGLSEVVTVWSRHTSQHLGALPEASRGLLGSGLARVLVHPVALTIWIVLALSGAVGILIQDEKRRPGVLVGVALIVLAVLVFGLSNPAHPRYAVPLVLLSSGHVIYGARLLVRVRWALAGAAVAVIGSASLVLPATATYRRLASPPIRALEAAESAAERRSGVMVVDRTLHSFVVYRESTGRSVAPMIFDHVIELGTSPPPTAARTVMVFDNDHGSLLRAGETRQTFSCDQALLRLMAQDRFLDVTVVDGAAIENPSGATGPFVILE